MVSHSVAPTPTSNELKQSSQVSGRAESEDAGRAGSNLRRAIGSVVGLVDAVLPAADATMLPATRTSTSATLRQGDIAHLTLQHRQHQIVIRTRFVQLNREGRYIEIFTQLRTNTGKVNSLALRARPNRWAGRTTFDRNDGKAVECNVTHHINYATNIAVVELPRTCVDNPPHRAGQDRRGHHRRRADLRRQPDQPPRHRAPASLHRPGAGRLTNRSF